MHSHKDYRWLNRFAWTLTGMTGLLIGMGGLVTSHEAGLAVPDWPTSYGYNMFLFPLRYWRGGIFYEHTHRLAASLIGMLTIVLAVWLWRREPRRWVRRLGALALFTVVLQGVLGGIRVTLLEDQIGIVHATLAQLFFAQLAALAFFTSRWWWEHEPTPGRTALPAPIQRWTRAATVLVFGQLILGATMRHQHAGLAIPDFPLAYGQLWPSLSVPELARVNQHRLEATTVKPITAVQIQLQMLHRLVALLAVTAIAVAASKIRRAVGPKSALGKWARAWAILVGVQFALGALTIWSQKAADVATAHVVTGALTFVTGVLLTLGLARLRQAAQPGAAVAPSAAALEAVGYPVPAAMES